MWMRQVYGYSLPIFVVKLIIMKIGIVAFVALLLISSCASSATGETDWAATFAPLAINR